MSEKMCAVAVCAVRMNAETCINALTTTTGPELSWIQVAWSRQHPLWQLTHLAGFATHVQFKPSLLPRAQSGSRLEAHQATLYRTATSPVNELT